MKRTSMRRLLAIAALAPILAAPGTALALTPTTPAAGAVVTTTHPTFAWTLDGQAADTVAISRAARTTPAGDFYSEDSADVGFLADDATSWAPTSPLPAGAYWWSVKWHAADYSTTGATTPIGFTIPVDLHGVGFRVGQYKYSSEAYADASWWGNVRIVTVACRVLRGRKVIARGVATESYATIGGVDSERCYLRVKERYDGQRLTMLVDVTAGGVTRSATRKFVAR